MIICGLNLMRLCYRGYTSCAKEVSIYLSISDDPFHNLAFEDWIMDNGFEKIQQCAMSIVFPSMSYDQALIKAGISTPEVRRDAACARVYEKIDLTTRRILFLWRNKPTIVIGRHQNPWLECNIKRLAKNGVNLARRKSGGGTVYHDLGNLNITFFSHRSLYNRKENLALIVKALKNKWKIEVQATPRDDILLENKYKEISGTSSKLGRVSTYHHCTLLLDVDMNKLEVLLQPTYVNLTSKATDSIRADVKNLCEVDPSINFDNVAKAIASEYSWKHLRDERVTYQIFDPSNERDFPGISGFSRELQTWQWIYGKTPRFSVPFTTTLSSGLTTIIFRCFHGVIEDMQINTDHAHLVSFSQYIATNLRGVRFWREDICSKLKNITNTPTCSRFEKTFTKELLDWINKVLF